MSEIRFKLTNVTVVTKCLPPATGERTKGGRPVTQRIYWDAEDRGFGLLVGVGAKTFIVQKDINGRTVRTSIGRFPTWTADQARKRAKELLVKMDTGVDPNAQRRASAKAVELQEWQRFTLDQAIVAHQDRMCKKDCVPKSITDVRTVLERYCREWLARPICELTRKDCIEKHRLVTDKSGKYAANGLMRAVRAAWNTTEKLYENLPGKNPTIGVEFNREERRQEPIPWAELPTWRKRVMALENPVRRAYQLTVLLTGLRRTDAAEIRWAEIDFTAATVHRPKPKGGKRRAFTIPLAGILLRLLARHRSCVVAKFGENCEWVFPTRNRAGQVVPLQEPKETVAELPSPHRLRDTFTTACYEAGVDEIAIEILTNHRPAKGSVTRGYIGASTEHLRLAVEKTAKFLRGKLHAKAAPVRKGA